MLYKKSVIYIGMARGKSGAKARLKAQRRHKADLWSHFSVFEVWDNISREQVQELEGIFRHIYRRAPAVADLVLVRHRR